MEEKDLPFPVGGRITVRDMKEFPLHHPDGRIVTIAECLVAAGMAKSKGEARRLIQQGGVTILDPRQFNIPE